MGSPLAPGCGHLSHPHGVLTATSLGGRDTACPVVGQAGHQRLPSGMGTTITAARPQEPTEQG